MRTSSSLNPVSIVPLVIAGLVIGGGAAAARPFPSQAPPQTQAQTPAPAQPSPGDEKVWQGFIAWFKTAQPSPNPLGDYAGELGRQNVPKEEIERRFAVIMRFFGTRTEGVEIFYDKTYSRPALTGRPDQDGFASAPSEFLLGALAGLGPKPGRALDVGMGQGRNAVALARAGWTVTGFDISGEGVAAAGRNAAAAGVRIEAVKADYASFDFGREAWDLIALIFAWAPVDEPAFVERLRTSLKPGGLIVYEHFFDTPERRHAPMVRAQAPGAVREAFVGFEIVSYEETKGTGDWGGPDSNLVRLVARKR